jgi:hypothetical protein
MRVNVAYQPIPFPRAGSRHSEQGHQLGRGRNRAAISSPTVSFGELGTHWWIIVNLLAGSLLGAWAGAEWATRVTSEHLYRIIVVLLVVIAGVLLFAHDRATVTPGFTGWVQVVAGIIAGYIIGVVAALLGLAGGNL